MPELSTSPTQNILKFFRRRKSSASSLGGDSSSNNSVSESSAKEPCTFSIGVSEDRNRRCRKSMEDTHTYIYNFGEIRDCGYFAVFDGHAGPQVADWCSRKLHGYVDTWLRRNDSLRGGNVSPPPEDASTGSQSGSNNHTPAKALCSAFLEADAQIGKLSMQPSGCTAVVGVIRWESPAGTAIDNPFTSHRNSKSSRSSPITKSAATNNNGNPVVSSSSSSASSMVSANSSSLASEKRRMLYIANVGDARAVLCRNGQALRLTYDHKASDPQETKRIRNLGGMVMNHRVNGILAVTRSLGDSYMKDLITGAPYTTSTRLDPTDEFIIIACDGLWDVCKDSLAVQLIRNIKDPKEASQTLVNYALNNFSTDNITVMVIRLDQSCLRADGIEACESPATTAQSTDSAANSSSTNEAGSAAPSASSPTSPVSSS